MGNRINWNNIPIKRLAKFFAHMTEQGVDVYVEINKGLISNVLFSKEYIEILPYKIHKAIEILGVDNIEK